MKQFLLKLGGFFWSWGFLKFILLSVTLIIFLYVEEDWRGAKIWAATKAEWEAKGENLDYNHFIPPPIPDDQNLGAIPLFKLEPDPEYKGQMRPLALERAFGHFGADNLGPISGNWQKGEPPDMEKMSKAVSDEYMKAFKTQSAGDMLAQLDALYPFTADLRAAGETRPFCRLPEDYTISPPMVRPLELLTKQIKVAQILTLHAILALHEHQSDLALADIKTSFKLASGAERDPSLVGALVAIAMVAITDAAIYDGLTLHAWNDAQLAELDEMLTSHDFLAEHQFAMRCEAAETVPMMDWVKKVSQREFDGLIGLEGKNDISFSLYYYWPSGWLDQSKSLMVTSDLDNLSSVDPKARRVFPEIADELQRQAEQALTSPTRFLPWNILPVISAEPIRKASINFARAQVWLDEVRIACALERYRLAKNGYPASLDELVPADASDVPRDIIDGEPYHYQARPDGTFLLYSVGWNQKDDGGTVVYKEGNKVPEPKEGDWVWPVPQGAVPK